MRQLWQIEPDIVHPGIGTANVRRDRPALDKIPPYMMQVKPMEDQIRRIVHGDLVHLPNDLLALLRSSDEFLLLVEFIYLRHRMPLVPATTFGDKPLPKGINRVIEVDGRPQKREPIVPRDLVGAELREEHRFKEIGRAH